jgi:hypothetical protein
LCHANRLAKKYDDGHGLAPHLIKEMRIRQKRSDGYAIKDDEGMMKHAIEWSNWDREGHALLYRYIDDVCLG